MRVFYKGRCVDYTQGFHLRERWYAGGRGEGGGGRGGDTKHHSPMGAQSGIQLNTDTHHPKGVL